MSNPEILFEPNEFIVPVDAKPGIPRVAPVRKEPEIPNPTIPGIPREDPRPFPLPTPSEPIKTPAPAR